MNLKLKNPLAFFDLETTGTNVSNDRIIEIHIIKMKPNGEHEEKNLRVNPQIPIPEESSLIHGIYDKDVKDLPPFKAIAKELHKFLEGCDLSGFNIIRFDVPMLVEEFLRENIDFDISNRKLVDSQKIFHLMEKRTLSAAYEFYCKKSLEDAHSAEADTRACMEVLFAQVEKYQDRQVVDTKGNPLGTIKGDVNSLHNISSTKMVDLAGRFVFNDQGVEVFNFGKFKNRPILDVLQSEPAYYDWMMRGDFPLDTKRKLTEIRLKSFKYKR
ncbi:DNA polymerase-3 subunit epsilon [Catalinimonas alkaloidigena]|uniref:3'-5' exonuclease n=1 Tax=Catalinimonas alkaloidigena TaxID=1075417 RepID=UPI002405C217|nr:3'-5' exonuclease [Catalinimonas alkaloidigena]MDF9795836.1 DNA polymerase-3 subunit epsilon [Catalinimonas alkaloidigena]